MRQAIWADEAAWRAEKPSDGLRRSLQRPKPLPRPLPYKMRVAATTSPIPVQQSRMGRLCVCCRRPEHSEFQHRPRPHLPGHICADTVQAWNFLHVCVPGMQLGKVWEEFWAKVNVFRFKEKSKAVLPICHKSKLFGSELVGAKVQSLQLFGHHFKNNKKSASQPMQACSLKPIPCWLLLKGHGPVDCPCCVSTAEHFPQQPQPPTTHLLARPKTLS